MPTLTEILKATRKEQFKSRMQYGELYHRNFYKEVQDKNRVYYEDYHPDGTENPPLFPLRIPHKGKNKGKYISFHYLMGWKARKIRGVQEISPQIQIVKHILFYIGTVYHVYCAYAITFTVSFCMNSSSPQ